MFESKRFLFKKGWLKLIFWPFIFIMILESVFCNEPKTKTAEFLNHDTSVHYVGIEACRSCHTDIYNSFIETGMGQSFAPATRTKSSAKFNHQKPVFDKKLGFYYLPFWIGDSLYIKEFSLEGKDTNHQRIERVDYIIGSGQHTNSHLGFRNGYVFQLPLTWYAQKQQWDLPPGFEGGRNVRFSREVGMECMSCHNAMPKADESAINKFISIPNGIDCERCHGPGELHVKEKLAGNIVDTSKYADYTIVNPKRLSWERQTDLCQRCHLQGNAILKSGKGFGDFRPGMKLADYYNVFMPKFKGAENEFIMASHAQRLQESKCFIQSNKNMDLSAVNTGMNLTCINCHNPHVSVKYTGKQIFNNACMKCHDNQACKEIPENRRAINDNCVSCHMPKSGTVDIPHVTVHDHKIRKPSKANEIKSIREFAGLYCVTKGNLTELDQAQAFLNYREKFEGESKVSFDSAAFFIQKLRGTESYAALQIHYAFLQNDDLGVLKVASNIDTKQTNDYWMAYRIGQSAFNVQDFPKAEIWLKRACEIAPNNLKFKNKLMLACLMNGKIEEAIRVQETSLSIYPNQEDAWSNLGFAYANLQQFDKALECYNKELKLFPFHQQALVNRAGVYHLLGKDNLAIKDLKLVLKINPNESKVKEMLNALK
jgi:tetratricopeptide (TPR) repeat protein